MDIPLSLLTITTYRWGETNCIAIFFLPMASKMKIKIMSQSYTMVPSSMFSALVETDQA